MTGREIVFCCILLVNTIVSVLYLIFGLSYIRRREKKEAEEKTGLDVIREAVGDADEEDGEDSEDDDWARDIQEEEGENSEDEDQTRDVRKEEGGKPGEDGESGKDSEDDDQARDVRKEEDGKPEKEEAAEEKPEAKEATAGKRSHTPVLDEIRGDLEEGGKPEEEEIPMQDGRIVYVIRFFIMLFCPVVGPIFFGVGHLLFLFVFRQDVSLEDVVFSKERVRTNDRADEERERNMAPLEEAIAVSDKESLRSLMLNVIRGDVQNSLAAIALALNSQDSETSHYAASVLQDELNNFRGNVQKVRREIEKEEDGETDCEYYLIPYMNNVLEQKVFTEMEQANMVKIFSEVGETLYRKNRYRFTSQYYEWICLRLLDVKDFEEMEKWCDRAAEQYPDELSSYTSKLKLYFTSQQKDKFFETLEALKKSSIVIDRETLALIRTFS